MSTHLSLTATEVERSQSIVDMLFSWVPERTDWDAVLARPPGVEEARADMIRHQPRPRYFDPGSEHSAWVDQQRLRVALRQARGVANVVEGVICGCCTARPVDPVLGVCLACAEERRTHGDTGSYGSCHFLRPCYDPDSMTWGILGYESFYDVNAKPHVWVARGFASHKAAHVPLDGLARVNAWVASRYAGADPRMPRLSDLLDLNLPLSAEDFTAHCRKQALETLLGARNRWV
jgi:hypothetical protein